jgi:hypothetical protein
MERDRAKLQVLDASRAVLELQTKWQHAERARRTAGESVAGVTGSTRSLYQLRMAQLVQSDANRHCEEIAESRSQADENLGDLRERLAQAERSVRAADDLFSKLVEQLRSTVERLEARSLDDLAGRGAHPRADGSLA